MLVCLVFLKRLVKKKLEDAAKNGDRDNSAELSAETLILVPYLLSIR